MATQANAARTAAGTPTTSLFRAEAPQIRTLDEIQRKAEQIMDLMDRGVITPKQAEQMNMTHKALRWPVELYIRFTQMKLKYKGDIGAIPKDAPPVIRQLLGMPTALPEAPRS